MTAKIFGWAIYAAGFAIWLFGYFSAGHATLFDWNANTPWWVFSSFVPQPRSRNRTCADVREHDSAFTSGSLVPLRALSSLGGRDPRVAGIFGVADLVGHSREPDNAAVTRRSPRRFSGVAKIAQNESHDFR